MDWKDELDHLVAEVLRDGTSVSDLKKALEESVYRYSECDD